MPTVEIGKFFDVIISGSSTLTSVIDVGDAELILHMDTMWLKKNAFEKCSSCRCQLGLRFPGCQILRLESMVKMMVESLQNDNIEIKNSYRLSRNIIHSPLLAEPV